MAKGSEQFTWAAVGGKQPCRCCRQLVTIDRVRVYSSGVTRDRRDAYVVCDQCWPDGWRAILEQNKEAEA